MSVKLDPMLVLLERIRVEVCEAQDLHGRNYATDHEALAVLWEEFEEVKAEVWKKRGERDRRQMVDELVQVAAVAVKWAMQLQGEVRDELET